MNPTRLLPAGITRGLRHVGAGVAAAAALAIAPTGAQADWLGLSDGQYLVTLSCDFPGIPGCPGSGLTGSLTVAGAGATQFDFTLDNETFAGDPDDGVFDGSLADFDYSTLSYLPNFRFLSLRLITDGAIAGFGPGDRWWVYCRNFDNDSCTPAANGRWSARLVGQVPEPGPWALALSGLLGLAGWRRRSHAARV